MKDQRIRQSIALLARLAIAGSCRGGSGPATEGEIYRIKTRWGDCFLIEFRDEYGRRGTEAVPREDVLNNGLRVGSRWVDRSKRES